MLYLVLAFIVLSLALVYYLRQDALKGDTIKELTGALDDERLLKIRLGELHKKYEKIKMEHALKRATDPNELSRDLSCWRPASDGGAKTCKSDKLPED